MPAAGLICKPTFSKSISCSALSKLSDRLWASQRIHSMPVENLALSSAAMPQTRAQTGIMEISKPWLSKETNTRSRSASDCFVLKIVRRLQLRICLKHSLEGFDLSNQVAFIYITTWRQEKQETVCSVKKKTEPRHGWHYTKGTHFLFDGEHSLE